MVALVTGGARGIGKAISLRLAKAGYSVAINYISSEAAADELCASIRKSGGSAIPVGCDVAGPAGVAEMVRRVENELGTVSLLVNNAGIAEQLLFTDITDDSWRRMLAVNLDGAFYCSRAVLPGMIRAKQGRIINISSMWGISGGSCEVHYSAAKSGLIGLTKALAKEAGPSGITVNCVAPGYIDTDMNREVDPAARREIIDNTPLGRAGSPDDIAGIVRFLASDEAAFITGQVISVDGGYQ